MESWSFPIVYKYSPFDKSIKSTNVYGVLLLRRYYLSLANEMQQSNGKLHFSDRIIIRILHLTNRSNRSNRLKFMGPFYNGDIF